MPTQRGTLDYERKGVTSLFAFAVLVGGTLAVLGFLGTGYVIAWNAVPSNVEMAPPTLIGSLALTISIVCTPVAIVWNGVTVAIAIVRDRPIRIQAVALLLSAATFLVMIMGFIYVINVARGMK